MCDFEFDFNKTHSGSPSPISSSVDGAIWSCPHEPIDGQELCEFHAAPEDTPEGAAHARLINELRSEGQTNIYGAKFEDLSLRYQNLRADTRHPIDLSHITVNGTLDLRNAVVDRPLIFGHGEFNRIKLNDAYFIDEVRFERSVIKDDVSLTGTECRAIVEFSKSHFYGHVDIDGGIFRDSVYFETVTVESFSADGTDFYDTVSLNQAKFNHGCSFDNTTIEGDLKISESAVTASARFSDASVTGGVYSNQTEFAGDCNFNDTKIEDGVHLTEGRVAGHLTFRDSHIGGVLELSRIDLADTVSFAHAIIDGEIRLTEATLDAVLRFDSALIKNTVRLADAALRESVSFNEATVEGTIDLRGAALFNSLSLADATVEHFELSGARLTTDVSLNAATINSLRVVNTDLDASDIRVDASDATLSSGKIDVGGSPLLWLDCEGATLGDVIFKSDSNKPVFENLRIQNTTFDGFDFQAHRKELAEGDFTLHTVRPAAADLATLSPTDVEVTYLNAKQGAKAVEDDVARRKFFTRQMQARRRHYFERLQPGSDARLSKRLDVLPRWLTGWFLSVSCGYGERPSRVLSISTVIILLYGIMYQIMGVASASNRVFDAFLLSLQSFISLIIGPPDTVGRVGTVLVISEAFFGAIFLSLFVVTLTRAFDVGSG